MIEPSIGFLCELCGLCEKKTDALFKEILKKDETTRPSGSFSQSDR
jgi:hypothetical protein